MRARSGLVMCRRSRRTVAVEAVEGWKTACACVAHKAVDLFLRRLPRPFRLQSPTPVGVAALSLHPHPGIVGAASEPPLPVRTVLSLTISSKPDDLQLCR